jgi:hypothetical protein
MSRWPKRPSIYEINTRAWLEELADRHERPLTLETVPVEEWDALGDPGVDAIWFMGVWEPSPASMEIAREHPDLQAAYREALSDYCDQDIVGSPYAVRRYAVAGNLGGPEGLAAARSMLTRRGLRLILDYVPNHVARDHPWVIEHPEYFIQGDAGDLRNEPDGFFIAGEKIIACGRDPYFPPWTDTAQLNAFHSGYRTAAARTLLSISGQCDGVRCDMAMLPINQVFARTWSQRAGAPPDAEFWRETIGRVRRDSPDFLFLAETYWDLEWELLQQGFDYCYDKRLYDRMAHGGAESIREHLQADLSFQDRLIRFIENHDEPRAAQVFASAKLRAAALAFSTLPGAKLFHEGQFDGRRVRLPVQLRRRPAEPVDADLETFYGTLRERLRALAAEDLEWQLCECRGWPDNSSYVDIVAWCWSGAKKRYLIVINFSERSAQCRVRLPWPDIAGRILPMSDLFSGTVFLRAGDEILASGLFVDLPPWGYHFLALDA